jgi:hypothetical protein
MVGQDFLEKLAATHLVKKLLVFVEPEHGTPLPRKKDPVILFYPEPVGISPQPRNFILLKSILILSPTGRIELFRSFIQCLQSRSGVIL